MTITDVINGWSVRILRHSKVRRNAITFVAHSPNVIGRAFFVKYADARQYVRDLREHKLTGRVVRAQVILKTAGVKP